MTNVTYHSEVVGSLLRPPYLLEARRQFEAGQLSAPDFKAIEDRAVNEAIALQESVGVDVITDGEMRRYAFYGHLIDALEGFDKFGGMAIPFRDETGAQILHQLHVVVGRLKWRRNMCAEEWVYLRSRKTLPAKMTLPDVWQTAANYDPQKSKAAYPTQDEYLADLVDITRREIEELIRLGCTYIQFDAPYYTALLDPLSRERFRQQGLDPDRLLAQGAEVENAVIAGYPGITFAIHLCRGNNQSMFMASGDYHPIAQLFSQTHFDRFLLEYDDERSGGFEPLRHVPDDRTVVLGLVSTKKAQLEPAEELRQRIKEATRYIPLERLALSPQCGFASTMEGNHISFEDQRRKLELVVNVAREVWGG
ncbi:MAG TPA: cobalamin-independent methionine synthase II family protein [Ktedonobacteraceae bacterium]|nr:cobalamin-independent methionine synthase II family protein [Ktedonobacteraceae bacterium]